MLTKQAIYHQFTSFLGIAGYLFLLFGILALHESVVSAKNGIEYHFYGFAIINALVLGKVILVADDFHFAEWFKERGPYLLDPGQSCRVHNSIADLPYR